MTKQMILHAATDTVGSECTTELDCTEEEWEAMTEDEQRELCAEFAGNIMDTWVTAEEEET
jgi:hypothetical protein